MTLFLEPSSPLPGALPYSLCCLCPTLHREERTRKIAIFTAGKLLSDERLLPEVSTLFMAGFESKLHGSLLLLSMVSLGTHRTKQRSEGLHGLDLC